MPQDVPSRHLLLGLLSNVTSQHNPDLENFEVLASKPFKLTV